MPGAAAVQGIARRTRLASLVFCLLFSAGGARGQALPTPIFTPPSGTATPVVVTLTNLNSSVATYFTLDGTLPDTNSLRYTGPLVLSNYTVIRARAFQLGQPPSPAISGYYYPVGVAPANSYVRQITNDLRTTPQVVLNVSNATNVASFTVEERLPAPLQAIGISGGGVWNPATGTIRWGPLSNTPSFSASYRVAGLAGVYPVNGSESVDGQWTFDPGPTFLTIAPTAGVSDLPVAPPSQLGMPWFTPPSGSAVPADIALSSPDTNAVIHYTLDGSSPTEASPIYSFPLHFDQAVIVRARAFKDGWLPSAASVAYFGPRLGSSDMAVVRSVDTNALLGPLVSLLATPGTNTLCYSVEERLPAGLIAANISAGGVFLPELRSIRWGPFVDTNAQSFSYIGAGLPGIYPVQAVWSVDGVSSGEPQGTNLVILSPLISPVVLSAPGREPAPVISPASSGVLPVTVIIADADTQAELHYTLDGTTPTLLSPQYTGALVLASPTTLRARAFGNGSSPSAGAVAYFGNSLPTPDIQFTRSVDQSAGFAPVITLSANLGATNSGPICYTVEELLPAGLTPLNLSAGGLFDAARGVVRWGPFFGRSPLALSYHAAGLAGAYPLSSVWSVNGVTTIEAAETILAIVTSPIGSVALPEVPTPAPAPVVSPATATNLPVTVTLACADPQAQIRYTLDGSSPTSDSALYLSALVVASPGTVRARSFSLGFLPSAAAVGYYSAASSNSLELVRSVSGDATFLPAIHITAAPRGVKCYAVTETLASGLTPSRIGQNAVWDAANRTIKWGPFPDSEPRVLTYEVTGPTATYALAGQGSFDGQPAAIGGTTTVRIDQTTVVYGGNTNDGFGGAIGHGSLVLSDDGTNIFGNVIASGPLDNALVIYLAPSPTGFSSTLGFNDAADPLRSAISGYTATQNNGGPGQSILSFASGFRPTYAIALQPGGGVGFGGLWELAAGGDQSLRLVSSVYLSPAGTDNAGSYRFSLNVTNIGLTPGAGQSFALFGTFVSDTGFRSTEAVAGELTGIQGWNPFSQTAYDTYQMIPAVFPLMVAPPESLTVFAGQDARFSATAIGASPLVLQWQLNGTNLIDGGRISGSQSSVLTIAGTQLSDMGAYSLVASNSFGTTTNDPAILRVIQIPPTLSSPSIDGSGQFTFVITSNPGTGFDILMSSDLVTWTRVGITTNLSGHDTITIPVGNQTIAFYRLQAH